MRLRYLACLILLFTTLAACNRSIGTAPVIVTPAVNTLIAAGTKPAPLEVLPENTPSSQETGAAPAASEVPVSVEPEPTQAPLNKEALYAVIRLGETDLLNVRAEPGLSSHVLFTLPAQQRDLKPTGQEQLVDEASWLEVEISDGSTGWVSSQFLTEQVENSVFCQAPQVNALVERLITSVMERDGDALAEMVSPLNGLMLYHNVWNPPVTINQPEDLRKIFYSTVEYDWGIQEGSGLELKGSFKELVYPKLVDVFSQTHTVHCNVLEQGTSAGGTTGIVAWPVEYSNLNFMALYRAAPASQELNWRTWVVGIEYVNGIPYVAVLMQFYWEI
ncbi:MAG: SH3 domain-containing protein [Anaerolineales bacterium]|jgi:hypothetical protein|nr:SH3 domain-containing protein [Anaerolineales bacterium]